MKKINKILVANRGEIAVRIMRSCKELGIETIAIHSDIDKDSYHLSFANSIINLGGSTLAESYLNKEKIIQAAITTNSDAIHPGYGFLSENADFIALVEKNNLIFIGPSSNSVRMMGNKTAARELMKKNNVPFVPGTIYPILNSDEGEKISEEIGYPILIKAAAGGGGKGMKKVFNKNDFRSSFESAVREAEKAFGDGSVYIEKLIENPKHIEVQILGDKYGNIIHLFERDCSSQRRHQKIIEESPSVVLDDDLRNKITSAAINAAKACGYYNAGTIELLLDQSNNFYFLEMNTRLQVEHPVTELITGFDLVKEQINIAEGHPLSINQNDVHRKGHAIEARIYAEDCENGFLPSAGKITHFISPKGRNIRIDEGADKNSFISLSFDPMIAKIISYGLTRSDSISNLIRALKEFYIGGIKTNIPFLIQLLNSEKFIEGNYSINYVEHLINDRQFNKNNFNSTSIASIIAAAHFHHNKKSNNEEVKIQMSNSLWRKQIFE